MRCETMTGTGRMRLRHNKHAHQRMPNITQLSAVEVVAHHGQDHVFRLLAAVHQVRDGWWWSCGCVSKWFTIKSHNSRLQEENEDIINRNEAMIDQQIIAIPIEHVRVVARILGDATGRIPPS